MSAIKGFSEETFTTGNHSLILYGKGDGPGVILLHELPGLTQDTVEFAEWIAGHGFHVVMPLLFGRPLQHPMLGLLKAPFVCIRKEFNNLNAGKSSPITMVLRALCRKIHSERGGPGVGAVGMCYTGGFIFAMMVEAALLAPVAAQLVFHSFNRERLTSNRKNLRSHPVVQIRCRCSVSALRTTFVALRLDSSGWNPHCGIRQGQPGRASILWSCPGKGTRHLHSITRKRLTGGRHPRTGDQAFANAIARSG